MKKLRTVCCCLLFLWVFALPVSAESTDELYRRQYRESGMEEIENTAPDNARQYLKENGADPADPGWVNSFSAQNIFFHMFRFVKEGAATPLKASAGILAIILLTAALHIPGHKAGGSHVSAVASVLSAAVLVLTPVFSLITSCVNTLKGISVFLLGFLPVFAAVTSASGAPATAASMSALLLTASEGVSALSSFLIAPFMGGYLALSISASVSPLVKKSGIAEGIKKAAFWVMGLLTAVFTAILGIQTAVNSSADTLGVKTAKFLVGSAVPVAGSALSEAIGTVSASMGLLRASVGIYAAVVCLVTFLPLLAEVLLWRLFICLNAAVAGLFSLTQTEALLKAVDAVLSVLAGLLLLIGAMFIICFAVVVSAGRGA